MTLNNLHFIDLHPEVANFRQDVIKGLGQTTKSLSPMYFYDERGSQLFDDICALDEYYLTRTEMQIMKESVHQIIEEIGPSVFLIEYGSGSSWKVRLLLEHFDKPAAYIPIDISKDHLLATVKKLAKRYPRIPMVPICADYTNLHNLPDLSETPLVMGEHDKKVVYFPGSTIGNLVPDEAVKLLRTTRDLVGSDGGLLIGVDTKKEKAILEPAYNDSQGISAEFNLNLLHRMNRELDTNFDVKAFEHHSFYNEKFGRIENHLRSLQEQTVSLQTHSFKLEKGETIHTEYSYKYDDEDIKKLTHQAGFVLVKSWKDDDGMFGVHYLRAE
jgi:dimethylhistidine N-methyltransferase